LNYLTMSWGHLILYFALNLRPVFAVVGFESRTSD
jgi:hypothetical protein